MGRNYKPWWAGARLLPFWSNPKRAKRRQSKRRRAAAKVEIKEQLK